MWSRNQKEVVMSLKLIGSSHELRRKLDDLTNEYWYNLSHLLEEAQLAEWENTKWYHSYERVFEEVMDHFNRMRDNED